MWRTAWETWEKIDLCSGIYLSVCTHPLLACSIVAVMHNTMLLWRYNQKIYSLYSRLHRRALGLYNIDNSSFSMEEGFLRSPVTSSDFASFRMLREKFCPSIFFLPFIPRLRYSSLLCVWKISNTYFLEVSLIHPYCLLERRRVIISCRSYRVNIDY